MSRGGNKKKKVYIFTRKKMYSQYLIGNMIWITIFKFRKITVGYTWAGHFMSGTSGTLN